MGWWPLITPRRIQQPPRLEIILYSRRGCHLCDDAESLLLNRQSQFEFELVKMDVDSNPDLARNYGECVPVVLVNGKLRFRGRIEVRLLDRLLRAMSPRT